MTTTSWTTTAAVPPNAWAAMTADVRRLLDVSAAGGSTVTGPDGTGAPIFTAEEVGFTVTAPPAADGTPSPPLTVRFTRAPVAPATTVTGTVTTNAPATTGLVLATLTRASRHWGGLATVTSDAGTVDWAVAEALVEDLFGDEDRAVSATPAQDAAGRLSVIVGRAQALAVERAPAGATLVDLLTAAIGELTAERNGLLVADAVLNPPPPPAPAA